MIDPDYCRTMARYNAWQNRSLCRAATGIGEAARRYDRGAFFGSIHATLSHLLWGDTIWMSRFAGWPKPAVGIGESVTFAPDWQGYLAARAEADEGILAWAEGLGPGDLDGDLAWFSGALGREVTRPLGFCVAHFFNHQTHHRGQVHGMLTGAGARPEDTDLFAMPDDA